MISPKLVLTAAHCIQSKNNPVKRSPEKASFFIGKYNLESLVGDQNHVTSSATQFIIHPQWNFRDSRYDADIAIAVLLRTVQFSKFIQPICLWTASNSYEDLIGRAGTIAGKI